MPDYPELIPIVLRDVLNTAIVLNAEHNGNFSHDELRALSKQLSDEPLSLFDSPEETDRLLQVFRFVAENPRTEEDSRKSAVWAQNALHRITQMSPDDRRAVMRGSLALLGPFPLPKPSVHDYSHLFRMVVFQALASCQPEDRGGAPFREVKDLFQSLTSSDPKIREEAKTVVMSGPGRDDFVREKTEESLLDLSEAMTRDDFYTQAPSLARLRAVFHFAQKNSRPKSDQRRQAGLALAVLTALEKLPCGQRIDALHGKTTLMVTEGASLSDPKLLGYVSRIERKTSAMRGDRRNAGRLPADKNPGMTKGGPIAEETDSGVVHLDRHRLSPNWRRLLSPVPAGLRLSPELRRELEELIVRNNLHLKDLPRTNFGGRTLYAIKILFDRCAQRPEHSSWYSRVLVHFLNLLQLSGEKDPVLVTVDGQNSVVILADDCAFFFLDDSSSFLKAVFAVEREIKTEEPPPIVIFFHKPEDEKRPFHEILIGVNEKSIFRMRGSKFDGAKVVNLAAAKNTEPARPTGDGIDNERTDSGEQRILPFRGRRPKPKGSDTGGNPLKGALLLVGGLSFAGNRAWGDVEERPFDSPRAMVEGLAQGRPETGDLRPETRDPSASLRACQGQGTYGDEFGEGEVGVETVDENVETVEVPVDEGAESPLSLTTSGLMPWTAPLGASSALLRSPAAVFIRGR